MQIIEEFVAKGARKKNSEERVQKWLHSDGPTKPFPSARRSLLKQFDEAYIEHCEALGIPHYPRVPKSLYIEHIDLEQLSREDIARCYGAPYEITIEHLVPRPNVKLEAPKPAFRYEQLFIQGYWLQELRRQRVGRAAGMPMHAWPIMLQGRDLIMVNAIHDPSREDKVLTFMLPVLLHLEYHLWNLRALCIDLKLPQQRCVPHVLIIQATRFDVMETRASFKRFADHGLRGVFLYDEGDEEAEVDACQRNSELLVSTPKCLVDLVKKDFVVLSNVSMVVIDDADRFISDEFQHSWWNTLDAQLGEHQTIMLAEEWSNELQKFAETLFRKDTLKLNIALKSKMLHATQIVKECEKTDFLKGVVKGLSSKDKLVVFCQNKLRTNQVVAELKTEGTKCINGDDQRTDFWQDNMVLVVTGRLMECRLDLKMATIMFNYDFPCLLKNYMRPNKCDELKNTPDDFFALVSLVTPENLTVIKTLLMDLRKTKWQVPHELLDIEAFILKQELKERRSQAQSIAERIARLCPY